MALTRDYSANLRDGNTQPLTLGDFLNLQQGEFDRKFVKLEYDPSDEKAVYLNRGMVISAQLGAAETLTEIGSRTFAVGYTVALYITTRIVVPSAADLGSKTYRIEYESNGHTTVWKNVGAFLLAMPTIATSQGQGFATIPQSHRNTYLETVDGDRILFAKSRNNRGRELFVANILSNAGSGTTVKLFEVS